MTIAPQMKAASSKTKWTHWMKNCVCVIQIRVIVFCLFLALWTPSNIRLLVWLWKKYQHINMHINRSNNLWHVLCTKRSTVKMLFVWLLPLFRAQTFYKTRKNASLSLCSRNNFAFIHYIIFASENMHRIESKLMCRYGNGIHAAQSSRMRRTPYTFCVFV